MRVGFGTTVLARGLSSGHLDGIGVYTRSLYHGLVGLGVRPLEVGFGRCGALTPVTSDYQPFTCLPGRYPAGAAWSVLTGLPYPGSGRLWDAIDLFHAPDHHIPFLRGVPVVATIMDAIPLARPEWASTRLRAMKNFAFRQSARSAQHVITISQYSKAEIVHYFGIPEERVGVTYLGVNPAFSRPVSQEKRAAALERYGLEPGFFIFVGTIQPRKNVGRIIAAHQSLPMEMQRAHPLVIVGRNGWGSENLLPMLKDLSQQGTGIWLNGVTDEELYALLQSASALVYPSLYEGFGLPVLEGFAAGIPVISSNTTSIPEVAGDAALLVNPESADEIAEAMRRIVEEPALAGLLVKRGMERVKGFSWSRCAEETLAVYRQVS